MEDVLHGQMHGQPRTFQLPPGFGEEMPPAALGPTPTDIASAAASAPTGAICCADKLSVLA